MSDLNNRRERTPFPSSFPNMNPDHQKEVIAQKVMDLLSGHPSHFLVEVRIKPTNNVKVFVDADEGISLSDLVDYNRSLYKQLEGSGLFPNDDFSLEVSSPGLDEPLKLHRQYKKNIGRYVDVMLVDGTKKEGKLIEATEDGIVIETENGKGKKREVKNESILFDTIKNTKIQVRW
ncbi:MAG: ribosome maturation factor [Bacteroidota bacterium]|nr:ribosome maturation factor [Bacteroidota bacterium]